MKGKIKFAINTTVAGYNFIMQMLRIQNIPENITRANGLIIHQVENTLYLF